jgi:hypothetical protein
VYFRAETLNSANYIVSVMFGANGISLPSSFEFSLGNLSGYMLSLGFYFDGMFGNSKANFGEGIKLIILYLFIAITMPNTQQLVHSKLFNVKYLIEKRPYILGIIFAYVFYYIIIHLTQETEFLYFNF